MFDESNNNNNYYSGGEPVKRPANEQHPEDSQEKPYAPYYTQPPVPPTVAPPPVMSYDSPPYRQHRRSGGAGKIAALLAMTVMISAGAGALSAVCVMDNYKPVLPEGGNTLAVSEAPSVAQPLQFVGEYDAITNVVKKTASSVVEITTETKQTSFFTGQYVTQGAGSGVILTSDGYIVTNNHVIENASTVTVRTQDGKEYPATLIGTDKQTDLAVIRIEAEGLNAITFADSDKIEVGQLAVAIGNPLGELGGTVTNGIISAKDREITIGGETMMLLQTSAAVNPGNSGGGLFDQNGNLVGVINAKSAGSDIEGLGFAIPSNRVKEVTDDLVGLGYVTGRPQFGITVGEVNDIQTAMRLGVNEPGVYVMEVVADNGFEPGDRIVSIDGWEVKRSTDLTDILKTHKVGDKLSVVIKRNGSEKTITVTLQEKIPDHLRQQEEEQGA